MNDCAALCQLARACNIMGDYASGEQYALEALIKDDKYEEAYLEVARARQGNGCLVACKEVLNLGLQQVPGSKKFIEALAKVEAGTSLNPTLEANIEVPDDCPDLVSDSDSQHSDDAAYLEDKNEQNPQSL